MDTQLKKVLDFITDLASVVNELNREFRVFQFARSQSLSDIVKVRPKDISRRESIIELNTLNL